MNDQGIGCPCRYLFRVMFSASRGESMSGIGRGIAALLLAGAVAGAAAFAHQLGREAAPAPLRSAGIAASQAPPPLVVVAAPAPPLALPRHAARPSLRSPAVRSVAHPAAPQSSAPVIPPGAAT